MRENSFAALVRADVSGADARPSRPENRRVWRGFVVGLLLLPPNVLWVLSMESITGQGPYVSTISLFYNVVFIMVVLALLNALVGRAWPRAALNRAELTIVYVVLVLSTSVVGHDMLQVLVGMMSWGWWNATPLNGGEYLLNRTTPNWLVITDRDALYGFFSGNATVYRAETLAAWVSPIVWEVGFALVLVFVLACLSVLLRPLWADRERLTFPVTQLPLELANPGTSLTRSHWLWVGFTLAAALDILNGLHYLFPLSVIEWPVYMDVGSGLTDAPWKAIGWLPVTFYPAVIGLAFLIPVDLLLSCTFFFLWWKALAVVGSALGITSAGGIAAEFPFTTDQMFGGCVALALGPLLMGKRYFGHVWERIRGVPSEVDDSGEAMRFRTAAIGIAVGFALLCLFSVRAGMNPALALTFFAVYYALAIAVGRIRAELGSPVHDLHWIGPDITLTRLIGTANLSPRNLGVLNHYYWFNRAYRAHPMAGSLEGLQMAAGGRSRPRAVALAVMLATGVGLLVGFWVYLHFGYQLGLEAKWGGSPGAFAWEAYTRLGSWVSDPKGVGVAPLLAAAVGFGLVMLLGAARAAFIGWPLHPVALPITASWSIHLVWTPMFIAGLAKWLVLRYGGLGLYRRILPLFFGLIIGEAVVGCLWSVVGLIFHIPVYDVFHFS